MHQLLEQILVCFKVWVACLYQIFGCNLISLYISYDNPNYNL
jgi:hypothetical protein